MLRWRADQRLPYYPTEGMGRPGAPHPTVSLGLRTMEKGLGKLAQEHRVWGASILDVVNSTGDAGSTRPESMQPQVQESKYILCGL